MKHWKFHVWIDRQLGMFTVDIFEIVGKTFKIHDFIVLFDCTNFNLKLKIITSYEWIGNYFI